MRHPSSAMTSAALPCYFVSSLAALLIAVPVASAEADRQWENIGESGLGPWQIYIDKKSFKRDDDGHVHIHVLDDHRTTQSGVDRYDRDGNLYRDEQFQYQSTITHYVVNCSTEEEVELSIAYYDGPMGSGNLVLFERPNKAYWTDILFLVEPALTSEICG